MSGEKHTVDVVEFPKQRFSLKAKIKATKSKGQYKKILRLVLPLVIIGALILVAKWQYTRLFVNNQCNGNNDSKIYVEAQPLLLQTNSKKQRVLTDKVLRQSNSNSDMSCVYILADTAFLEGNTKDAEKYVARLKTLEAKGGKYVDRFKKLTLSTEILGKKLDTLNGYSKNMKDDFSGVSL